MTSNVEPQVERTRFPWWARLFLGCSFVVSVGILIVTTALSIILESNGQEGIGVTITHALAIGSALCVFGLIFVTVIRIFQARRPVPKQKRKPVVSPQVDSAKSVPAQAAPTFNELWRSGKDQFGFWVRNLGFIVFCAGIAFVVIGNFAPFGVALLGAILAALYAIVMAKKEGAIRDPLGRDDFVLSFVVAFAKTFFGVLVLSVFVHALGLFAFLVASAVVIDRRNILGWRSVWAAQISTTTFLVVIVCILLANAAALAFAMFLSWYIALASLLLMSMVAVDVSLIYGSWINRSRSSSKVKSVPVSSFSKPVSPSPVQRSANDDTDDWLDIEEEVPEYNTSSMNGSRPPATVPTFTMEPRLRQVLGQNPRAIEVMERNLIYMLSQFWDLDIETLGELFRDGGWPVDNVILWEYQQAAQGADGKGRKPANANPYKLPAIAFRPRTQAIKSDFTQIAGIKGATQQALYEANINNFDQLGNYDSNELLRILKAINLSNTPEKVASIQAEARRLAGANTSSAPSALDDFRTIGAQGIVSRGLHAAGYTSFVLLALANPQHLVEDLLRDPKVQLSIELTEARSLIEAAKLKVQPQP